MKGKITIFQLAVLLFCCRMLSSLFGARGLEDFAYGDSLKIHIVSMLLQALLLIPAFALNKKYSDDGITASAFRFTGKAGGTVIGAVYYVYIIFFACVALTRFGNYMISTVYPDTPFLLITGCMVLVCAYAARFGIEAIGRISLFAALLLTVEIIAVFFLLAGRFETVWLYSSVAGTGVGNMWFEALIQTAENSDLVLILLLLPQTRSVPDSKEYEGENKIKKGTARGKGKVLFYLVAALTCMEAFNFLARVVFGNFAGSLPFPTFLLETFSHMTVFKNINIVHALPWTFIVFVKITIYITGANNILRQLLPGKAKTVGAPLTLILITLGVYLTVLNRGSFATDQTEAMPGRGFLFYAQVILVFLLPLFFLIISRRKRKQ
ncbi:MAG: GerAB/ArcD/ProY family transporter [Oscillospiraceae bacterium]|nr:GerAB/ArcD/ProY family transporter [Oscillospiraceae bacterium]